MKYVDCVAVILLLIGGLNWGLVGVFDFNVVGFLFGSSILATVVYALIGVAAVYKICTWNCGSMCRSD